MRKFLLSLILLIPTLLWSQRMTVSGYIYEKGSLETLPGVIVYEPLSQTTATSNSYGFYSLTFPQTEGSMVIFMYQGFDSDTLYITENTDINYNTKLQKGFLLEGVQVTAQKHNTDLVQMSSVSIGAKEVKALPALLGEKDVFKTLLLLPGVQSGTEGTSGIYVRGGGPDQNLIILDEATIYNANHLLGFFSIFNGDAIKSVELLKGGFPARYGGRLSSVIDITMKDGNKEAVHGEGGIGILSSHLMVEGPIVKNKASFMISGRATYADLLLAPIMKIYGEGSSAGYYFFDLNAKFNWEVNPKNKLFVSAYFGRDKFHMSDTYSEPNSKYKETNKMGLFWQNATATARWNHLFTNKIFSNLSFIFNDYKMDIYDKFHSDDYAYSMEYNSGIRDYTLKYDVTFLPDAINNIRIGAAVTYHEARPSAFALKEDTLSLHNIQKELGLEYALYAEDEINIHNKFRINPGIRLVCFSVPRKTYFSPEPRIALSYNFLPNFAIKASYAMMSQSMLLLSTSTIGLPTDLWVPVTEHVRPQRSHQVALGLHYDLRKPDMSFSIEGYYKKMNDIIGYKEGASFFLDAIEGLIDPDMEKRWSDNITTGQGWSYGVEFLVRKNLGKFTGWIGYTLSWTEQQFDDLNFGRKFFARYDRRHDVSIALMYSPTKKINLSLAWTYATGNAVTLPTSIYPQECVSTYINNYVNHISEDYNDYYMYIENYGEKNNLRMKPFHHLDIGIQFVVPHRKSGESIFEISIYNVYNHKNAFFYFVGSTYDEKTNTSYQVLKQVCIFPIIPTFSYHFKF